jgi:hypothetical protein
MGAQAMMNMKGDDGDVEGRGLDGRRVKKRRRVPPAAERDGDDARSSGSVSAPWCR